MTTVGVVAFVVAKGGTLEDAQHFMEYLGRTNAPPSGIENVWAHLHEAWAWVEIRRGEVSS